MKTITKLKKATKANQYENTVKKTPIKTVSSKRLDKEDSNEPIQQVKRLTEQSTALQGILKKRQLELDKINEEQEKSWRRNLIIEAEEHVNSLEHLFIAAYQRDDDSVK